MKSFNMNANFISRALCFHGQPMQKIWEDERGAGDLQKHGVPPQVDYSVYMERQKYFTFQDRAKRLKLHQFFARKANDLYDMDLERTPILEDKKLAETKSYIATLPPYEVFVNKNQDKYKRWRAVLEGIKPGDVVYGVITKTGSAVGNVTMMIKPLCTAEPVVRYLSDMSTKAYVHYNNLTKQPLDKRGKPRSYATNDFVCCEVLEVSVDADRLYLGMEGVLAKNKNITLGVVSPEDLPDYYCKANDNALEKYEDCLFKSKEFLNPNYDALLELNGLNVKDSFTMMGALKQPFPKQEYANELRQTQASKWAFRSVAEGIEHFKNGHHVEAFQCLNKALNIDPRNVEGLVARGALYANKGSFLKAVDDFEKALKLNAYHVNARKYMGETLVALGRRYEEESLTQEAVKAYKDCLNIIPNHEQARLSLEAMQQRMGSHYFDNVVNVSGTPEIETATHRTRSSSKSSSSGSTSSDNSDSSSDSEYSDLDRRKKENSLSPLSKRMALHAASLESTTPQQFNQPFFMANYNVTQPFAATRNPNEFKLDDDDTESRVRKLLHEASKHKKKKSKKSKKKKSKKSKKSNYKEKDPMPVLNKNDLEESFNIHNARAKLNDSLQTYEKNISDIKKRQDFSLANQMTSTMDAATDAVVRKRSETPPPRAPSMKITATSDSYNPTPPAPPYIFASTSAAAATATTSNEAPKLSFQIRRPVKIDKFGLVRIATPLTQRSPTHSPSRSRSRTSSYERDRYRSRKRSQSHGRSRRHSRSRSSSYDRGRRNRRRYSRSMSRSPLRSRSRSHARNSYRCRSPYSSRHSNRGGRGGRGGRSSYYGRRRTPSPFVPRDTPPPRRRSRSRDRSDRHQRSRSPQYRPKYGNRVWKRSDGALDGKGRRSKSPERWPHDKYSNDDDNRKVDDGPSIEEIDEIINQAQKQRKQEIIKRDKDILKKPAIGH